MQIGSAYSTATPRMALIESSMPVCWMSRSARLLQWARPAQIPTPSSSLQMRISFGLPAWASGRSRPSLVVMSGTETTNSMLLARISRMMLLPRSPPACTAADPSFAPTRACMSVPRPVPRGLELAQASAEFMGPKRHGGYLGSPPDGCRAAPTGAARPGGVAVMTAAWRTAVSRPKPDAASPMGRHGHRPRVGYRRCRAGCARHRPGRIVAGDEAQRSCKASEAMAEASARRVCHLNRLAGLVGRNARSLRTRLLQRGRDPVGLVLVHALLDRLGRALDQVLGLLETEPGKRAHLLDHLDLLFADRGQHHGKLALLLGGFGGPADLRLHWWGQRCGLVEYSFDERVFRQVCVVLSHNGFCFPQRSKPPLNLEVFISSDAFYNPAFFHEQLEFTWPIVISGGGCKLGCKIDASGGDPIPFYDPLVGYFCRAAFPVFWRQMHVNPDRCGD